MGTLASGGRSSMRRGPPIRSQRTSTQFYFANWGLCPIGCDWRSRE
jgi:hypothetical protein